jgi:hypothetical protein
MTGLSVACALAVQPPKQLDGFEFVLTIVARQYRRYVLPLRAPEGRPRFRRIQIRLVDLPSLDCRSAHLVQVEVYAMLPTSRKPIR